MTKAKTKPEPKPLEFREGTRTVMSLLRGRTLTVTHGTTDSGERWLVEFEAGEIKQGMLLPDDGMQALVGAVAAMTNTPR